MMYARLVDSTGQYNGWASVSVANIDKLAPNNFTPTATSNTSHTRSNVNFNAATNPTRIEQATSLTVSHAHLHRSTKF